MNNLPSEILLWVSSHLDRSSDILHFALTGKKIAPAALELLYRHPGVSSVGKYRSNVFLLATSLLRRPELARSVASLRLTIVQRKLWHHPGCTDDFCMCDITRMQILAKRRFHNSDLMGSEWPASIDRADELAFAGAVLAMCSNLVSLEVNNLLAFNYEKKDFGPVLLDPDKLFGHTLEDHGARLWPKLQSIRTFGGFVGHLLTGPSLKKISGRAGGLGLFRWSNSIIGFNIHSPFIAPTLRPKSTTVTHLTIESDALFGQTIELGVSLINVRVCLPALRHFRLIVEVGSEPDERQVKRINYATIIQSLYQLIKLETLVLGLSGGFEMFQQSWSIKSLHNFANLRRFGGPLDSMTPYLEGLVFPRLPEMFPRSIETIEIYHSGQERLAILNTARALLKYKQSDVLPNLRQLVVEKGLNGNSVRFLADPVWSSLIEAGVALDLCHENLDTILMREF